MLYKCFLFAGIATSSGVKQLYNIYTTSAKRRYNVMCPDPYTDTYVQYADLLAYLHAIVKHRVEVFL